MSNRKPFVTRLRNFVHPRALELRRIYLNRVWGMSIGEGCRISTEAKLDKTNPRGVIIGAHTYVTFGATILTHDFVNRRHVETRIGRWCFIGCRAIIMPGVTIGDHCVIGAGALVREDVPDRCIVVGNPGRVVKTGIDTVRWGLTPHPSEAPVPLAEGELRDPETGEIRTREAGALAGAAAG